MILKSAIARAVEQQVIARNPADAFRKRLPRIERKQMATLTAELSAYLLRAIEHTRVYGPCTELEIRLPPYCYIPACITE